MRHCVRFIAMSLKVSSHVLGARISKARIAFANLRNIWCQNSINLSLRSIAGDGCCQRIRNETVRPRVFGCMKGTSIGDCIQHNNLRWLGHVLRMPDHRLLKKTLFSVPDSDWWNPRGGQSTTWQKGIKSVTKGLGSVGVS